MLAVLMKVIWVIFLTLTQSMITLSGAHCTTDSILIGHATCQIQHLNIHSTVLIYLLKWDEVV
jgi:hypothetical protein